MHLPMSDEKLLGLIRQGDEQAFLACYRRHQGGIYRFALRMSGEESIAQDVTQEVFLTLIGAGGRTEGFDERRGSLTGYLYGIAHNQVLRRLQSRHRWAPLEEEEAGDPAPVPLRLVSREDPLLDLTRRETIETVRQMVLALPAHYREAVVLCDLHEMSYQEAAEILDCSLGTVRSRLHRGRALLVEKLREDCRADLQTRKYAL